MSWIDIGETTKGVLIGGGITLATSVVLELFRSRAVLKQQKELFAIQSEDAEAVTKTRYEREDEVAKREKERADEEAVRQQRVWSRQKIWDRRVQAYDDTIKRLKQMQDGFQEEMNHSLNPPFLVNEDAPYVPSKGFEKVEEVRPLLDLDVLFLNDRAIEALKAAQSEIHEAVSKARMGSQSLRTQHQMISATGVGATRKAIQAIRQEALEHLGDKDRSLQKVVEDTLNLTSSN